MKKILLSILFLFCFSKISFAVNFNKIEQELYKSVDRKYTHYIDSAGHLNLPEFNKNSKILLFEIKTQYNITMGIYTMKEYIKMFEYNNNIFVNTTGIDDGIYYIDMQDMRFLPDIKQDSVAENIFNKYKQDMFCKIEIQNKHNIKFYNNQCKNVFKKMLNMDFHT